MRVIILKVPIIISLMSRLKIYKNYILKLQESQKIKKFYYNYKSNY